MGVFLNTIKRLLEALRPNMENQMRVWGATLNLAGHDPYTGQPGFGDRLGEVTVELRAKYKNTMQAMIDKLAENVRAPLLFCFHALLCLLAMALGF